MTDRFLRYSFETGRKICLIVSDEKGIRRITAYVLAIGQEAVTLRTGTKGKPFEMPLACILSASYARGDEGDTLKLEMEKITHAE